MKLQFLWDDEKTRSLFKIHLILFFTACFIAIIFGWLLPQDTPYRLLIISIPTIYSLIFLSNLLLLKKISPHLGFLMLLLLAQLGSSLFMAITGGFSGVLPFSPFAYLFIAAFSLGADATAILGSFSIATFIGIFAWRYIRYPTPTLIPEFLIFSGIYVLVAFIDRNVGNELSIQIEARKRMEQVDDLKNEFITLTSHYLRTPLTTFKYFIKSLEETDLGTKRKAEFESIDANLDDLEILVENMLTITSIEKGKSTIAPLKGDLNELVTSVVNQMQEMAKPKNIQLEYQSPNHPVSCMFDNIKLKQVISNIIDNAIKFNHPGGLVRVSLQELGNNAILKIADTGSGIKKEALEDLFSPFNKSGMEKVLKFDKPGVGLSLYLVKLVIEAHKGKISVESQEGTGSTFTVSLPISK